MEAKGTNTFIAHVEGLMIRVTVIKRAHFCEIYYCKVVNIFDHSVVGSEMAPGNCAGQL